MLTLLGSSKQRSNSCPQTYKHWTSDGAIESSTEASADNQDVAQKQWPAFGFPIRAHENPDFFLIWLKPYEQVMPKPIQEMINQQVRPQTEQISSQIISSVPGSEQVYQRFSQFMSSFNNFVPTDIMGGLTGGSGNGPSSSSGSGGNSGLSSMMQNFGRRR